MINSSQKIFSSFVVILLFNSSLFLDGTDNHGCQEICRKHRRNGWESYDFYYDFPNKQEALFHAVQYELA